MALEKAVAMRWRKLGRIYVPDGSLDWARHYAMMPTPTLMRDGSIRLYIGSCDEKMVGRVGFLDLDPDDPTRILRVAANPVLDIGRPGSFDDNGVVPACTVWRNDELWLYYVGFQLGVHVRYFMFSGLAVSTDGGDSFLRAQAVPVLDRRNDETIVRTAACVRKNGDSWRAWYVGGDRFINVDGKQMPTYLLRTIDSVDGMEWHGPGKPLFDFASPEEYGFGRPWVWQDTDGDYNMIHSVRLRGLGYRFGRARSSDGLVWQRLEGYPELDVSDDPWESSMICYASRLSIGSRTYLFYNGNDHGRTGVGVAVLD